MEDIEEWVAGFLAEVNTCMPLLVCVGRGYRAYRAHTIGRAGLYCSQDPEIIEFAAERITELKELELAHYRAYLDLE